MEAIISVLKSLLEPGSILLVLIILLLINFWIFKKLKTTQNYGNVLKNSISACIIFIGIIALILTLPIEQSLKGQILSFLAIVISAGIALSSTTVLGNLIAGIMNNSMKRFRIGDLISVKDLKGRVTKKSIFHTEIQLEDSNFMTIPNLYIANNPLKLTRKKDPVISTSVSLGYNIPRTQIEESLKEAALLTGLTDPYVYITELGDFSVSYKIHGFLKDSNMYFSSISLLNANVMDVLHKNKIEIVSPTFMNQINANGKEFIPKMVKGRKVVAKKTPEDLIFDEANKSEEIEKKKDQLDNLKEQEELLHKEQKKLKKESDIKKNKESIEQIDKLKTKVEKSIEQNEEKSEK